MQSLTPELSNTIIGEAQNIQSWDEWEPFEEKWFQVSKWPVKDNDDLLNELDRKAKEIDGDVWESLSVPYIVSPDIYTLYENIRWLVFNKLEPEAASENSKHPELYGKACYYDKVWTKNFYADYCPFCKRPVVIFTLNL